MIKITNEEFNIRREIYDAALQELKELHGKMPTILETCLYVAVTMDEDVEKILKIFKEKEKHKDL